MTPIINDGCPRRIHPIHSGLALGCAAKDPPEIALFNGDHGFTTDGDNLNEA